MRAKLPPLLLFTAIVAAWQGICWAGWVSPFLMPSPDEVLQVLWQDHEELAYAALLTGVGSVGGFLLSVISGIGLALALSGSDWAYRAVYPYAVLFQTVPIIAVAPLLVIWLGYGLPTVIASAFLASVFPVIMASLTGIASASPELRDLFRLYRASRRDTLLKLILPMALPSLLTGLRFAAGLAVIGTIVGEFVGGGGLGNVIDIARTLQRVDKVFAAVFLASLLGALAIALIDMVSRWSLKAWEP
ncbi:ABC transporter permease [bacterium]|nr:ABC transporter permease [bacterium]